MTLQEIVAKYRELAGDFGKPVPLAFFKLGREATERLFSVFDEDYQISRYIHMMDLQGERFTINGFPNTHVSIDKEIETLL